MHAGKAGSQMCQAPSTQKVSRTAKRARRPQTQSQRNQQNDRFYSLCPVGLCYLLNWIYGKYSNMHNDINKYQPHCFELHCHQIYASQRKWPDTSHYNCHVHMHTNTTIIGSNRQFMLVLRLLHRQGYKSCDCSNSHVYVILSIIG